MKNKNLLQKVVFAGIIFAILLSAAALMFGQTPLPSPRQEKLLNGLKVVMWNDARADKVTVKIRVHAGSAFDPQGREGTMQLLADDLFPNDASRDFFKEDLGGSLETVATYDYLQISASSKPESVLLMLETLAAAISNPTIDKETTAKVRTALLAKLKVLEADPSYVADQAVAKRLFGTFPYGRPERGSTATVQNLVFADLIDAKQRFLTADNATMTISGNYDRDLTYRAIRRYFGGWLKADKKVPATFRQPDDPDITLFNISTANAAKSEIRFATRGFARSDKDYPASTVLTSILRERFPKLMTGSLMEQPLVSNKAYALPGYFSFSYLSKEGVIPLAQSHQAPPDAPNYVRYNPLLVLFWNITDEEFSKAKSEMMDQSSKMPTDRLWLDADTYRIDIAGVTSAIQNVTIADVRRSADRMAKNPVVTVAVK